MSGTRTLAQVRGKAEAITGESKLTLDIDMIHAMEARDEKLVVDEIMSGSSESFTYSFNLNGKLVKGVSVIGARHLAVKYKKLKHRLVCSISKRGSRQTYITYPAPGVPFQSVTQFVPEWGDVMDDFYTVVVEITDISTGLTEQTEITESRWERKSRKDKKAGDPDEFFERPHFERIAQSKAFRNGVIHILPQDIIQLFINDSIASKNNIDLTKDWLEEMRSGVLRYGTAKGIPVNRVALAGLDSTQVAGLRDAAQESLEAFKHALSAAGCLAHITPLREISMDQPLGEVVSLRTGEPVAVEPEQQQDVAPAVTNQGSSMRRVDLSNPPQAMEAWIETYGYSEARRLAAKHGWDITQTFAAPPEPERDLAASMPKVVPPKSKEDSGPAPIPHEEEKPAQRGRGRTRQAQAQASNPDLFSPDPRQGR